MGIFFHDRGRPINAEEAKWLWGALRTVSFFKSFPLENVELILQRFRQHSFRAGINVIRQGMAGRAFYIIRRGAALVCKKKFLWWSAPVADLGPGGIFGEMSLLHDEPTTATVRTSAPAEIFSLERRDFIDIVNANPELAHIIRGIAAERRKTT